MLNGKQGLPAYKIKASIKAIAKRKEKKKTLLSLAYIYNYIYIYIAYSVIPVIPVFIISERGKWIIKRLICQILVKHY
jgi:hypothetical protein